DCEHVNFGRSCHELRQSSPAMPNPLVKGPRPMFRFAIRDVLWLTVVVALVSSWSVERADVKRRQDESENQREKQDATIRKLSLTVQKQRDELLKSTEQNDRLRNASDRLRNATNKQEQLPVDYPVYYPNTPSWQRYRDQPSPRR